MSLNIALVGPKTDLRLVRYSLDRNAPIGISLRLSSAFSEAVRIGICFQEFLQSIVRRVVAIFIRIVAHLKYRG